MRRALILTLFAARPLLAGYVGRELVLPIIGRAASADRVYQTAVWITNVSDRPATATLSFLEAGHANPSPRQIHIQLPRRGTRVFNPLDAPLGALRIASDADLLASARISTIDSSTSCAAIPARFAVSTGQSSTLQGYLSSPGQYKLYVVEISGEPLAYSVAISDTSGRIRGEKRLFLDRYDESRLDLTQMFPDVEGTVVRIEGTNGSGKMIAMGLQRTPGSHDASAFEMSFPAPSRFALSWMEGLTYVVVGLAVIVAALIRR